MQWIKYRLVVVCLISFFGGSSRILGASDDVYRFVPGVHISSDRRLTKKQLELLQDGLRFWTGFSELAIDANGNLTLGDRSKLINGSKTARELIIAAVDSQDSFTIERCDNSSAIAFAQLEATSRYVDASGGRHSASIIRVDFSDFTELTGKNDAHAAFDPAINVIHELVHGVLRYFDTIDAGDPLGDCERYVNQMRLELGLPQRQHYFPNYTVATNPDGSSFVQGELTFIQTNGESGRQKELVITFNLDRVFDRTKAKPKAKVQAMLLAMKQAQSR
jgi:hypothetical protein